MMQFRRQQSVRKNEVSAKARLTPAPATASSAHRRGSADRSRPRLPGCSPNGSGVNEEGFYAAAITSAKINWPVGAAETRGAGTLTKVQKLRSV